MEWTATESPDYMHMGACGNIQLYKHRDTRRYLNIDADCVRFYLREGSEFAEVDRRAALLHVKDSI